ncbi:MAG: anthranilate phosphoribosyltransferase [Endomicrobiia bacterium]|nr:anthranilate phosphoribosyltransferase [Endomicrobiia bacterium]
MIKEAIQLLADKKDLAEHYAAEAMKEIMTGGATDAQIAAFAVALRMKGETVDEISGCAGVMRSYAVKIKINRVSSAARAIGIDRDEINVEAETIVDTCGTGGDKTKTFNVSTATAFVVAGAGIVVAKHGNRAVSSSCGSADVLEKLGLNLDVPPAKVEECLGKVGIGFLYAPLMHGAMKYAAGPRKQIGVRTIFNILGPLTNPAGANAQVLGVYSPELTEKLALVLGKLGAKRAFVVHGMDSTDEISITGATRVSELSGGGVRTYRVNPEDFGLKRARPEDIKGGDADENAAIILSVLKGQIGPPRDIVLANAAAALVAASAARDLKDGVKLSEDSIDTGAALKKLESLKDMCRA